MNVSITPDNLGSLVSVRPSKQIAIAWTYMAFSLAVTARGRVSITLVSNKLVLSSCLL